MPYWIAGNGAVADCAGWATVKETNGTLDVLGCHQYKQDAIDQAIAISLSEGDASLYKGEYEGRAVEQQITEGDFVMGGTMDGLIHGRVEHIMTEGGTLGAEGDPYALESMPPENPAMSVRIYRETEDGVWQPTAYSIGMMYLDATRLESLQGHHMEDYPETPAVDLEEEQGATGMNRFKLIAESLKHKLENEIRSKKLETRTQSAEFEIRAVEGDGMSFSGYAAVFNSPSEDLGGFREFVAQGAFKRSLESRNRMMLLWNHDSSQPLASTRNGSLKLTEDKNGLFVEATLPNTQLGRDIAELIRTGTIDAMSFGFQVKRDSWSTDGRTRTLEDVSLHEVSLVSWPAYEGTAGSTAVRNYAIVAERMDIDAETLASAMFKFEQGDKLVAEEAQVIRDVLQKLSDEPEPEASPEMLTIKKKQFELLIKTLTQ
jgi:hypothetical protein